MENKILCPDCEKTFYIKAGRCSCGWSPLKKEEKAPPDFRCEYTLTTHRCPLPGTICPYPYSTQGPWYCADHWRSS